MALPRRKLGDTGLEVSVIGFGASPLGGVFQDIDEEEGIAAVHEAFNLGINFFDTSPFYGITKSETVLGKALKGLPRDQIVVATKVGRYGPEEFDFSAVRITRCFQDSLQRLQLDYVDIIQCHDIEFGDLDQIVRETLPALAELRAQGLVRHIGITGLPLKIYQHVMDRAAPGIIDVMLSYCHYCLNDRSLEDLLPYLRSKGVGVINASCLSMGLLTRRGPPAWHPAPPALKTACAAAAEAAEARGHDISRLALMWAVQDERIASTLVGMHTRELVRANIDTVKQALGTVDNPAADAEADTLQLVQQLLQPVAHISWPSGKPENN